MIDFSFIEKTGLRKNGELDKIFGVSRLMVYKYLNGAYPRGKNRSRIEVAVRVLADLVDKGKLPLSRDKTVEQREAAVNKITSFIESKVTH